MGCYGYGPIVAKRLLGDCFPQAALVGDRALITRPGRELCLATLSPDSRTRVRPRGYYVSQGLSRRGTPTSGESLGSHNERVSGVWDGAGLGAGRLGAAGEALVCGVCREDVIGGAGGWECAV